jgi:hypothetical protein
MVMNALPPLPRCLETQLLPHPLHQPPNQLPYLLLSSLLPSLWPPITKDDPPLSEEASAMARVTRRGWISYDSALHDVRAHTLEKKQEVHLR